MKQKILLTLLIIFSTNISYGINFNKHIIPKNKVETVTKPTKKFEHPKNKTTAILCGILGMMFLGFGLHRYYMRQFDIANLQLFLYLIGLGLMISVFVEVFLDSININNSNVSINSDKYIYKLIAAIVFSSTVLVWQIIDIIRIFSGDLVPEDGFEK